MPKGFHAGLVVLVCGLGLATAGAAQSFDIGFFADVDAMVAEARLSDAETLVEAEFLRSQARPLDDRLSLLDALADLQAQNGKPKDRGDTLWNKAALIAREFGADHPDLAPIYTAAGDAYLAAGATDRAIESYRAALRLDETYLDCAGPALGASHRRLAAALTAAGEQRAGLVSLAMADDPAARCAGPSGRSLSGRNILLTGAEGDGAFASVELFYGTDRKPSGALRPNDFYGWERGPVDYGRVTVAIPRDHKPGQVEAPSLLRFEWSENPALHVVVTDLEQLDETAFFESVAAGLADRNATEVFIFVHGFNTTFADAARRTAQIAYDLNYEGMPLFYAWPSRGTARAYLADSATVQVSARRLSDFLEDVVARSGARHINLIAHSMGSRALTEALELYAARHPTALEVFSQVIFAAPDVDADLFELQAASVRRLARRITLYTSSADTALSTSRALHGDAARAGGGPPPAVGRDFDTVDMTALGADLLQHTYFATEASALADILWLFWRNPSPSARCGMDKVTANEMAYWVYRSDLCDQQFILPAITLARRFGASALGHVEDLLTAAATEEAASELRVLHDVLADILEE